VGGAQPCAPDSAQRPDHRRFSVARQRLADYKEVKSALGGTVNDVVLTVVSGALAGWLRSRGVQTEGLEMRALVPVSVRTPDQRGSLGNQLAVMRGPLPVYIEDPVARLQFVREAMDGLKESKQAVGASTLAAVNNLAPPTVLAQASRLNFSTRLFNLIVTNVPGPQLPLYVLGRELQDLFPVAFLPEDHALAIAIMSYNGALDYGLLGDYDALPDIELITQGLQDTLAQLLSAARSERPAPRPQRPRAKAPTKPATKPRRNGSNGAGNVESIMSSAAHRPKQGPAADMRAKRERPARRRPQADAPES
jgi:diacylglycerol O-acyltransferase